MTVFHLSRLYLSGPSDPELHLLNQSLLALKGRVGFLAHRLDNRKPLSPCSIFSPVRVVGMVAVRRLGMNEAEHLFRDGRRISSSAQKAARTV